MLKRKEIIEKLLSLNLPIDSYYIGSGAGLVLRGIKEETCDIDITCLSNIFDRYIEQGFVPYQVERKPNDFVSIIDVNDELQLIKVSSISETSIDIIENFPVESVESIRAFKQMLNRPKDIKDIVLIDEYLKNTSI